MSSVDSDMLLDLLVEWEEARQHHRDISVSELCMDHPELTEPLRERIARRLQIEQMIEPSPAGLLSHSSSSQGNHERLRVPEQIGRYRGEKLLGSGGFGIVYLAYDDQLDRQVAIKVPYAEILSTAHALEVYRAEARSLAQLEHPHIVPIYDVGADESYACFLVSKYVEGASLAERSKTAPLTTEQCVSLIATIAETLHFAHTQGFVHRDVKPVNILLGANDHPFLIDFGLALDDRNSGEKRRYAGTPSYMSPEQARGEAHRVDGRSDIYSLGTVFYELLAGRRPFEAENHRQLLTKIIHEEPKPPRQIDDRVPKELERICLKAISKRVSERYTTAKDFADDLRCYLASLRRPHEVTMLEYSWNGTSLASPGEPSNLVIEATKVVPRGLRSYDGQDAEFFLSLLPGPRDRDGIPDSIRFWKNRIERRESRNACSICVLYGPSGSGKSSFVRAGLLPLLDQRVTSLILDATPSELEAELQKGIGHRFPSLRSIEGLHGKLSAIRRGDGLERNDKVLIVLDQFEQWLHGANAVQRAALIEAFRQCDGERLQALILVRDDFWMGVTRFMRELEVPLREGENSNANDLFSLAHARKILLSFGQSWGTLPDNPNELNAAQNRFLDEAVKGLEREGRVVPVRLSLFAEMFKHREWTPQVLKEVGGFDGLGVAFLESTFNSANAPLIYRYHQVAARGVLGAFLQDSAVDFRGRVCSYEELCSQAGYVERVNDFDDLMRILDSELRLITPIDQVVAPGQKECFSDQKQRRFQLAHDYLVPALRHWIQNKQRETRRGRAILNLREISSLWEKKRERRFLPTFAEYSSIRWFTRRRDWDVVERRFMRASDFFHLSRCAAFLLGCFFLVASIQQTWTFLRQAKIKQIVDAIQTAESGQLPNALLRLRDAQTILVQREIDSRYFKSDPQERMRLACAKAELGQVDSLVLCSQVGLATKEDLPNIFRALRKNRDAAVEQLRSLARYAMGARDWPRMANYAIAALYMDDVTIAVGMADVNDCKDQSQRRALIEGFRRWPHDFEVLAKTALGISDSGLKSAICLGMATIPKENVGATEKEQLEPIFQSWFRTAPDAVTHSAAGLPLFFWGIPFTIPDSASGPEVGYDWYVNSIKLTMIRIPPRVSMERLKANQNSLNQSSNDRELEGLRGLKEMKQESSRSLYMCDREIPELCYGQFLFDPLFPRAEKPVDEQLSRKTLPYFPATEISWFDAILFCNWLSKKEGLSPCYVRTGNKDGNGFDRWDYRPNEDGYRLPTEEEWELACLAGESGTTMLQSDPSLIRYVQSRAPTTFPGALHFPNAWGMFDMLGNVEEWCGFPDASAKPLVAIARGGNAMATSISSQRSSELPPQTRNPWIGFRICRLIRE